LIEDQGWRDDDLPCVSTLRTRLHRLGDRLRRVHKTTPWQKIKDTDAICDPVHARGTEADADPKTVRISVAVTAKVAVGDFASEGESRCIDAPQAHDHAMGPEAQRVPVGIWEVVEGHSTRVFGHSQDTSDLLGDCVEWWWQENHLRLVLAGITTLRVTVDNGPPVQARRPWCITRIAECAARTGLHIPRVDSPPYHSTYHPGERLWGLVENHGNGTRLDAGETALAWASSMPWKGSSPVVHLLDTIDESGTTLSAKQRKVLSKRRVSNTDLPQWDVVIAPAAG